jgi:hypothetical protein
MEVTEIDIEELSTTVFANGIKSPNYYALSFDNVPITEVFQSLLYMLAQGCKHIYQDSHDTKNNIGDLDSSDFANLESYFRSFGIKIKLEIVDKLPANQVNYDLLTIRPSTKLEELRYTIKHKELFFICSFRAS